jgi:hypothetical protein
MTVLHLSCRLYRLLLMSYPSALRARFGQEMAGVFEEQIEEAWQRGKFRGVAGVWSCALEELVLVALPAWLPSWLNPGLLRIGAISLLSTIAVFYFVLWGVTPPIHK